MSESGYDGPGSRVSLRRASKLFRAVQGNTRFLAVLIGTPFLVILLYSFPLAQNYVVEARTLSARITVLDPDVFWKLPKAQFCEDLGEARDLSKAASYQGTGCNPGLFREVSLPSTEIRIPKGVQILIQYQPDGSILFQRLEDRFIEDKPTVRLTDSEVWTEGSVLKIKPVDWTTVTLLEFAGDVVVGEEAGSGANGYLIDGRYEVRELFLRQYRPWGNAKANATTVVSDNLYRGDRIAFTNTLEPEKKLLTGFFAPLFDANARGIGIVISNGFDPTRARLAVESFGAREIVVTPSWIDRALRDPLLLALTAILGFAVTTLTFAVEIRKFNGPK
ncbi:MAG: hypothetical protein AAF718_05090 [Pseudomonadota bacterium]